MSKELAFPKKWWWSKRSKYNKELLVAGFIAFMLYCILGPIIIAHEEFEETIFEMAYQGVAYFIMICIANVLYKLGWIMIYH